MQIAVEAVIGSSPRTRAGRRITRDDRIAREAHDAEADDGVPEADHGPGQASAAEQIRQPARRTGRSRRPRAQSTASQSSAAMRDAPASRRARGAADQVAVSGAATAQCFSSSMRPRRDPTDPPLKIVLIYARGVQGIAGGGVPVQRCACRGECRVREEIAEALWYVGPGRAEIREERLAAAAATARCGCGRLYGAISRGTEALIAAGRVPAGEYQRMRGPFMGGTFPFPVKYGYATVGAVEAGRRTI